MDILLLTSLDIFRLFSTRNDKLSMDILLLTSLDIFWRLNTILDISLQI